MQLRLQLEFNALLESVISVCGAQFFFCFTDLHSIAKLPTIVIHVNPTPRYHVCIRLLSSLESASCRLLAGMLNFNSVRPLFSISCVVNPGETSCRFVDNWFVKIVCAMDTKSADPKCCPKITTDNPNGASTVGKAACTALCGARNDMPVANPARPEYTKTFTRLVWIFQVVISPAAIGIRVEAKSMKGV